MWVNNEESYLRHNLAYHHAIGVQRAYVFLDRCTDSSEAIVRSFPWASAIRRDRTPDVEYCEDVQDACAAEAKDLARAEGIDWLMHVDADELAYGGNLSFLGRVGQCVRSAASLRRSGRVRSDALREDADLRVMLSRVRADTQQVVMRTKEAVPIPLADERQFWQSIYFQDKAVWVRTIWDPIEQRPVTVRRFLGHRLGKSIVRTGADIEPYDPHQWTQRQNLQPGERRKLLPLPTESCGWHYHYLFATPRQWRAKYRRLSGLAPNWRSGKAVGFPKGAWRRASEQMSEAEAEEYARRWVFSTPREARKWVRRRKVVRDRRVRTIIDSLRDDELHPDLRK